MRVREHPVSTPNLVPERVRFFLDQHLPGVVFLFDDRFNHFAQARDDLVLFFPQGGLVGNLEKISHCFRAFPVQPAHGQTNFVHGLDHLIDQFAQDQPGQMQHR